MAKNSLTQISVNFNGATFLMDVAEGKMMSLNDIYAAAGSPANKESFSWFRKVDVAEFVLRIIQEESTTYKPAAATHLTRRPERMEKSKDLVVWCRAAYDLAVKAGVVTTKRGKGGGTWTHWKIATKYAAYLEPALESAILGVFQERVQEESNPELAYKRGRERAVAGWRRQGKTDDWIGVRIEAIDAWKSFTDVAKQHGVEGSGYPRCADSFNVPLLGGTAKEVRQSRGITSTNLRDALDEEELAEIKLAQIRAKKTIIRDDVYGNRNCSRICFDVSTRIAASR